MSTAMQVRLRHWPGMKVSWLGAGAVVHSGDEPSPSAAALVVSPHGSTECAVVISSHTVKLQPAMVEELAEVLANGLPRGFTAMRFVAWDGACATNERPAAAHTIAMRLGIDVIAAAGPLLGVPGGSLFAPIGRGEHRPGGFWRFRAGAQPARVGWRFPAPHWEADLGEVPELSGDLVLDQIPAGLWLHRRRVGSVTDLAYSVPTDHSHPAMILSHPAEEPLDRDELARGISVIPALAADRCVFTPYGQRPLLDGPIGPVVADVLGRAVHVRTGLPLCAPAGQRAVVTIDHKGLPRWRTFARELWHAPRTGAPRPVDWVNPCPDILDTPAGAATFTLGSGWVLEVIQAGLWIRPEHLTDPADWIRGLPVDVNRCAIIVGAPHAAELAPPGHMMADVLEKLPVDARKRAYLAVPRGAAPNVFILATALRDSLPEPGDVELVGPTATPPASALPAFPPSTTGSFPAVGSTGSFPAAGSTGSLPANGHRADGPLLVNGRPANGHPSGAHPTVSRPAAHGAPDDYDGPQEPYRNGYPGPRTGSFEPISDPRTGSEHRNGGFAPAESATGSFAATDPRTGAFAPVEPRSGSFAPVEPRGGSFAPVEPRTGSFAPVEPRSGSFAPVEPRTGSFAPVEPRSGSFPSVEPRSGSFAPVEPRSGSFAPVEPRTGAFPAADPRNGVDPRNGIDPRTGAFAPVEPATGSFAPLSPNGHNGHQSANGLHGANGHQAANGHQGTNGHQAANGHQGTNGHHGADGFGAHPGQHGHPADNGRGQVNGFANGQRPSRADGTTAFPAAGPDTFRGGAPEPIRNGSHPDLNVAPPRTYHREQPAGYESQGYDARTGRPVNDGYRFDAPDYDEHHFDLPTPPGQRAPVQRMPAHDEGEDQSGAIDDTTSTRSGREIRSHGKKGKTTRTDDKTSTQELDRLLGFFDEIRRAKAWDEDSPDSAADESAARRTAAGKPPAGPRRAR